MTRARVDGAEVVRLRTLNHTFAEIGKRLGCDPASALRALRRELARAPMREDLTDYREVVGARYELIARTAIGSAAQVPAGQRAALLSAANRALDSLRALYGLDAAPHAADPAPRVLLDPRVLPAGFDLSVLTYPAPDLRSELGSAGWIGA